MGACAGSDASLATDIYNYLSHIARRSKFVDKVRKKGRTPEKTATKQAFVVEPITSGATSDENMRPRETSSQTKETKAESSQSQRRNSPPKSLKEKANRKTSSPFLRKKYMTSSKDLEKNTKSHRVARL